MALKQSVTQKPSDKDSFLQQFAKQMPWLSCFIPENSTALCCQEFAASHPTRAKQDVTRLGIKYIKPSGPCRNPFRETKEDLYGIFSIISSGRISQNFPQFLALQIILPHLYVFCAQVDDGLAVSCFDPGPMTTAWNLYRQQDKWALGDICSCRSVQVQGYKMV